MVQIKKSKNLWRLLKLKKKPFWKKPLLITKKTTTQDPKDKDTTWVELEVYNPYKEKGKHGNKNS
mgnify:CR=1 FL=1